MLVSLRTRYAVYLVLVALLAAAPATASDEPPISSASEIDYPPFCFIDEGGNATGFSVELLRAALGAMDREVVFDTGPWAQVRGWLERGEVEALPLVGRTPERETLYDFSIPYMTLHGAIVVREGTEGIQDLADLRGRRVAVMKGDNAEEFLRRADSGVHIQTAPTFKVALQELSRGLHDAVVIQRLVALRLIAESGLANLEVINRPLSGFRQDFCFAVQESDRETLALLNEGLAVVMADGTYRHLHAKWFAALELPSDRRIVFGGDANYPPYEFLNKSGHPSGFTVDVTRALAREMGLDIQIRLEAWADVVAQLKRGEIDAIQGMFYSPQRDLTFDFSRSYALNDYVAVVRKDLSPVPELMSDLAGRRIGAQDGDWVLPRLKETGLDISVSTFGDQEDVLQAVRDGLVDCGIVVRVSALELIREHAWTDLVPGKRALCTAEYCYAVPNGHKALLARLDEGLQVLEHTGELRRIREKWLGVYERDTFTLWTAMRYSAMVIVPLSLVVFGAVLWSWSLRRQVSRRTAQLRDSEAFVRLVLDSLPIGIAVNSVEPYVEFSYVNDNFLKCYRISREDLSKPDGFWEAVYEDPEYRSQIRQRVLEDCASGDPSRMRWTDIPIRREGGETTYVSAQNVPVPGRSAMVSMVLDVTDRKRAEEALRRSQRLLDTVQRISRIGGWEWVVDRGEMYWSRETYRIHDMDPHRVRDGGQGHIARSSACYAEEERTRVLSAFRRCVEEGVPYELECRFTTEKGRRLWVRTAGQPVRDGGKIVKVIGYIQDITRWKQAEAERERLIQAIEQLQEMVVITDAKGAIQYVNPAFSTVTGYAREEAVGQNPRLLKSGEQDAAFYEDLWRKISAGETWAGRMVNRRKDGSLYTEESTISPVRDAEGRVTNYVAVKRDITDEIKRETQLLQARKMEAVGRLAGGVAHDFNNMLTVIQGSAQMALEQDDLTARTRADLDEILEAARHSADLTRQLLAFSRQQVIAPRVLDLNGTVFGMLTMLRRLIGEDVDLAWRPGEEVWPVRMDPSQLDQILANLCANARDAIPDVGKVTIETGRTVFDQAYCEDHEGAISGEYSFLAVSDDGCGMDAETLSHVFEPFFTTRGEDGGTGLGLATVYGIVKQNGGFVNAYSEPGKGSTFRIYLPRHAAQAESGAAPEAQEAPARGSETVLVVEDQPAILKLAARMLRQLGYEVLPAGTVGEALELSGEADRRIDLLMTDVVMPEMNGRELADRVHQARPGVKCLFMSGYTTNVIAHRGVLETGVHFIQKPFTLEELAACVRDALEQPT